MQPSLNRRLVVLPLLIIGSLAFSGKAAASEPYHFSLKDEESRAAPGRAFRALGVGYLPCD